MDAIGILQEEHRAAKTAMEKVGMSLPVAKRERFMVLKRELEMHDSIEERIFYTAVSAHPKTAGLALGDKSVHRDLEASLEQLSKLPVEDASWMSTFNSMKERLLKHVNDEEKNIFPHVREVMTEPELEALGRRMSVERERLSKAA
jgi:hemerythrin superfamily protein